MKTLLLRYYVVIIGIIIFLTSCSKEKVQSTETIGTGNYPPQSSVVVLNLVATHWTPYGDNNFSDYFINVFKSLDLGSSSIKSVTVYAVWEDSEYKIVGETPFLEGVLEKNYDGNNLSITYHSSNGLPFSYLNIEVVIEKG